MALPVDSDSTRPDPAAERRAASGAWMLVAAMMMFAALAIARGLG